MPIYKDNAQNRKLKRVGMGYGKECSPCKVKKKEEPKSISLQKKEKDIIDTWKTLLNPQLKSAFNNKDKAQMKTLYNKSIIILSKLFAKYNNSSPSTEKKKLMKPGGQGFIIRSWAKGKKINKGTSMGVDITSLLQ